MELLMGYMVYLFKTLRVQRVKKKVGGAMWKLLKIMGAKVESVLSDTSQNIEQKKSKPKHNGLI